MTHIVNREGAAAESPRRYRSELRAQQAEETRGRILDAAGRVMARGIASLSIPEVAREAGVSIPTVYRHFATKQDLLDAIYPHAERRAGIELVPPTSMDDFRRGVLRLLDRNDAFDDLARAAMASPAAEEVRKRSMPRRLAISRAMVDTVEPPLSPEARDRVARLLVVLTTSSSLRTWRDHLDLSSEDVAREMEAVVLAAIEAERRAER
jgi:AcrR family transcriptional regulator